MTGGAGFIGSHLCEALVARGDRVTALDDLSTGRRSNLDGLAGDGRFAFVEGSVTDQTVVGDLVASSDVVVHLAAAVGVRLIMERPLASFTGNLLGTMAVMAAADHHHRPVLLASSSEVYGRGDDVPLQEDGDRLLGPPAVIRWSYSTAKAADEVLAAAYRAERGTASVVVRLFNTVGPRQRGDFGMVLPRLVGQALGGRPLTVHGDGTQTRCFCHVADVVAALVALLESPGAEGGTFNIGSGDEVSVLDLARRVVAVTGSTSVIELVPYGEVYGPGFEDLARRRPDTARLRALTGWAPTRDLDAIIADVARDLGRPLA